jgi:chemotaxis protein MotA
VDWASVAGFLLAISGIVFGQVLEGGRLDALIQPAAFSIVFVGTLGAVLLQSGMKNFRDGIFMARWVVDPPKRNDETLAKDVSVWSATARREGLLSLEKFIDNVNDRYMVKGLKLIVDGIDPYKIREILDADISSYEHRLRQAAKVWESAGGYSPTIGILGAVLGLIHVMENLTDPGKLGGGIAVAFVATVYGVGLANLVYLPIANKLKSIIANEVSRREMLCDVFCSIANGDNARVLEERINSYSH